MNEAHLIACASPEWAEYLEHVVMPRALGDLVLGDDVLEIGAGPGKMTDILRTRVARLTAVELDDDLAAQLSARMAGTNVDVVHADATALPLPTDQFSGGVAFTMLHHVPTVALQDQIFAELARVVMPDGVVVLTDSTYYDALAEFHQDDVFNPVDPATLEARLRSAGFHHVDVSVDVDDHRFVAHATAG